MLVDSRRPIAGSINRALVARGLPQRAERELYALIGPPTAVAFSGLLGEPQESRAVAELVAAYRSHYREVVMTETEVVPGIPAVLAELGETRRLAVATSKARAIAEPLLDELGLLEHFELVAGPDLAAPAEDKTATVATALAGLGVEAATMVGDTRYDIVAARAHGLHGVGVAWGIGTPDELREAGADVVVDRPDELPAVV